MSKITKQTDGTLLVPDIPTVPFITGDGVGEEITPAMQSIVDVAVKEAYGEKRKIDWVEVPSFLNFCYLYLFPKNILEKTRYIKLRFRLL